MSEPVAVRTLGADLVPLLPKVPHFRPNHEAPVGSHLDLADRVAVGLKKGAVIGVPTGIAVGAGVGLLTGFFVGGGLVRATGLGIAMVGTPIALAAASSGAWAGIVNQGRVAGTLTGAAVGVAASAAAGVLLDVGVHQLKPQFLVAGAIMGGVAGLATAQALNKH